MQKGEDDAFRVHFRKERGSSRAVIGTRPGGVLMNVDDWLIPLAYGRCFGSGRTGHSAGTRSAGQQESAGGTENQEEQHDSHRFGVPRCGGQRQR